MCCHWPPGSREPSRGTMGKWNFSCGSQDSCQERICKWFKGDGKWHNTGVSFSWQPVVKSDAVHEGGLHDHSMLGGLCQHQGNLGYTNKGGNSKELVFIVSILWWVLSKHSQGCRLPPTGAHIGDKKPVWEVSSSSPSKDTPDVLRSAWVTGVKLATQAGLITHNVESVWHKPLCQSGHYGHLQATALGWPASHVIIPLPFQLCWRIITNSPNTQHL